MKLNEASRFSNFDVKNDGQFYSLGFVTHQSNDMLVFIEDKKYITKLLENPLIRCVITTESLASRLPSDLGLAVCYSPRRTFYELHNYLATKTEFYWKSYPTKIDESAKVNPTAYIADRDVIIGKGVVIEPNVTILKRVLLEDNSIIRAGTVLGSEGFEFKCFGKDILHVSHAGGVHIGKRVEIQGNSNVDRAVFGGCTEIGDDSKIDTMVHVGHNIKIGERCLIAAQTVLAGSTLLGNEVWVGPHSVISSELSIGDKAHITIGSVVTKDVLPSQRVLQLCN